MRIDVLRSYRFRLVRSAAVLALVGLVAGCSSDVARFDDGFYTGAVPQQPTPRAGIGASQPFPGDAGGIDRMNTGSVGGTMPRYGSNPGAGIQSQGYPAPAGNGGYRPAPVTRTAGVERSMLAPPSGAQSASINDAPTYSPAPAPAMAQPSAPRPVAAASTPGKAGWSNTGNSVTLRPGETIDALSDRYGVPTKAILQVNGMKSPGEATAGQQIIIPSYSYGSSPSRTAAAQPKAGQTLGTPPGSLKAPSAAASRSGSTVTVESGDSLMGIARRTGVSVADLRSANGLAGDNIRIGQTLVLPNGTAPPKRVATLDAKPTGSIQPPAAKPAPTQPKAYEAPRTAAPAAVEAPKVAAAQPAPEKTAAPTSSVSDETSNDVATAAPAGTGIDQFRWPVQGRVVKRYGEKSGARRSDGLDISVPRGTPVKAAENGVVIYAGDGLKEFGNTVLVKHDNGLVTVYGHADELKVKRGATVRRGEEIATAGVSGDTDTPMVHFEVRKDSAPVDPAKYLQ